MTTDPRERDEERGEQVILFGGGEGDTLSGGLARGTRESAGRRAPAEVPQASPKRHRTCTHITPYMYVHTMAHVCHYSEGHALPPRANLPEGADITAS